LQRNPVLWVCVTFLAIGADDGCHDDQSPPQQPVRAGLDQDWRGQGPARRSSRKGTLRGIRLSSSLTYVFRIGLADGSAIDFRFAVKSHL